jgi:hypothetical protein
MPPHLYGVPPPPQVAGAVHVPQLMTLPQPSPIEPHSAPNAAQVVGVQVPPLHGGQLSSPPHPSPCGPHLPVQVSGVHVGTPHLPA